jgi:phenylacetate-CoA ligase
MSRLIDRLYTKSPVLIQHTGVSLYGLYWRWLRFGPGYKSYLNGYLERNRWDQRAWTDWQSAKLKELLQMAIKHVPYYRENWSEKEKSAARVGQLTFLPLLEKDQVRTEPRAFIRQDINYKKELVFHTSGSTGTPIASVWTIQELRDSLALREARSARWAGVSFKLPRATFSGRLIEPNPDSAGPFYRFNRSERQVYLSAFHIRSDTATHYVNALWKHDVQWLTGYAVSYHLLAHFILEQNLKLPPLKALITTSEKINPDMRQTMEEAYGCRVYEEYSTVENALFASECEHGNLHVSPDAGIVEILRPDGSACDPEEVGEVITTCLTRNYQPLIRFRLGDMAAWDSTACPCDRSMPVIKEVVGRIEDVVYGPDGRRMVRFHGIFVDQPHVREGQIIQEAIDHITVKVVPTNGFSQLDIEDITQRIQQRLGKSVNVSVNTVKHIPRTQAGKFRAVISNLPPEQVDALTMRD